MLMDQRWWQNNGKYLIWSVIVLAIAGFLHQTQGEAILEVYRFLAHPFEGESAAVQEARLKSAKISELQQKVAELEKQNQQFQKMLGINQEKQANYINAPVIGRSADAWWQQVILGRGSADGIQKGYVVSGIGGLIGRVVDVTPHTSRVLLISDPTSQVGVSVTRSRSVGYIKGNGSSLVIMSFIEKVPDVKVGDNITTSNVSWLFPAAIPVGKVKSLNLDGRLLPEATVELSAPIDHLEWVSVQPYQAPF